MKIQDKQFTVIIDVYDVRSLVHGVSISFFMRRTLHTPSLHFDILNNGSYTVDILHRN